MKKVLIVYKKSFYEQSVCLNRSKKVFLKSEIARFLDMHKEHAKTIEFVERTLKSLKIPYKKCFRCPQINYTPYSLVVTVGGDGTFLHAARHLKSQTILGVNSDPARSVGKFCAATRFNFEKILKPVLAGKVKPTLLPRLTVRTNTSKQITVVNDILVCDENPAAMSRYVLSINGKIEYQRSSGVWISTAAGSSGAINSAGGKILPMNSNAVQYQTRELYYRRKGEFKLIGGTIHLKEPIKVRSQMRTGMIFLDGAHVKIPFDFGKELIIGQSPHALNAILKKTK
ncbi:MAG: hypothetical protein P9M07_00130 [Candidatus Aceula meridiana]|nr:hypothetical protein [Candidatus Aceula meridiana]